jgi:Rrf2 family nitric oxide-sensitive transcriptional repressor
MKLRRFTDYALRVLIFVAERPGRRCSVPEIAAAHRISEHHLVKIVHRLGRLGYLETTRGRGGGVALTASPESIDVSEVIRTLEGDDCPADCSGCILGPGCALAALLRRSLNAFYADLGRQTLADIIVTPAVVAEPLGQPRG